VTHRVVNNEFSLNAIIIIWHTNIRTTILIEATPPIFQLSSILMTIMKKIKMSIPNSLKMSQKYFKNFKYLRYLLVFEIRQKKPKSIWKTAMVLLKNPRFSFGFSLCFWKQLRFFLLLIYQNIGYRLTFPSKKMPKSKIETLFRFN